MKQIDANKGVCVYIYNIYDIYYRAEAQSFLFFFPKKICGFLKLRANSNNAFNFLPFSIF